MEEHFWSAHPEAELREWTLKFQCLPTNVLASESKLDGKSCDQGFFLSNSPTRRHHRSVEEALVTRIEIVVRSYHSGDIKLEKSS